MKKGNLLVFLISLFVVVSCDKTEWDKEITLNLKSKSDKDQSIEVANYLITTEDIELTITSIHIHGERLQADDVDRIYTDDININFTNPQSLNYKIELPVGTYEKLELSINFDTENSSPRFLGEIEANGNQPFQSSINIPLTFSLIEELQITNGSNENVILIDENTQFIEFIFNGQESFNGINMANWNGLMNANQGQSEIDLSSVLGAQFLEDINNNFRSKIELKISN